MTRVLSIGVLTILALSVLVFGAKPRSVTHGQAPNPASIQLPSLPDPAPVQLIGPQTAFFVFDVQTSSCPSVPGCATGVPAIASALASARGAGAHIFYTQGQGSTIVPELAPQPGDTIICCPGADKFHGSDLENMLSQMGITTAVETGFSTDHTVLYTGFELNDRGYTVVVPEDAAWARTDFQQYYALFGLLNEPSYGNLDNTPLKPKAVTLSRTDLISYTSAGAAN